jgi:hypothetical protein
LANARGPTVGTGCELDEATVAAFRERRHGILVVADVLFDIVNEPGGGLKA